MDLPALFCSILRTSYLHGIMATRAAARSASGAVQTPPRIAGRSARLAGIKINIW